MEHDNISTAGTELSPRDFVVSTGGLYVSVGGSVLLVSCLLALVLRGFLTESGIEAITWDQWFESSRITKTVLTADVLSAFVGSLAMIASGWAMQGELVRGTHVAMITSGMMSALYIIGAVCAIWVSQTWWIAGLNMILSCVCIVLFLLAAHSMAVLRQFPPAQSRAELAEEGIREYQKRKRKRLENME